MWIQTPSGVWVSADIKTQPMTAKRHAQNKGFVICNERLFDAHDATAQTFELYIATTDENRSAYLAFKNPPSSGNIAPIDFRGKAPAINAAHEIVDELENGVVNNDLRAYDMITSANGLHFTPINQRVARQ